MNGVLYQRRLRGWNQEELAQRAGLRQRTVSSIETGRSNPHPKTLLKLAQALGVEIADLIEAPTAPKAAASQNEVEPPRSERLEVPESLAQLLRERAGVHMPRSRHAVLGFYTGVRYHLEDLRHAFFETRFERVLDTLGYARLMHWRILGHEALAKREVALWLSSDALSVEHAGEALSRYEVEYKPGSGGQSGKLIQLRSPELFETAHRLPQPRLFGLEAVLGDGWLKALKLDEYAPRRPRDPMALQGVLFSYPEVL